MNWITNDMILFLIYVGGLSACFCVYGVVEWFIEFGQRLDRETTNYLTEKKREIVLRELRKRNG